MGHNLKIPFIKKTNPAGYHFMNYIALIMDKNSDVSVLLLKGSRQVSSGGQKIHVFNPIAAPFDDADHSTNPEKNENVPAIIHCRNHHIAHNE